MDKNDDSLKELEKKIAQEKFKQIKKLNEEQIAKEQEVENERIRNKKIANQESLSTQESQYNDEVEMFQGMIVDLIGDLNDLLMLAYRGRVGKNMSNQFIKFNNKVIAYKKELNTKNIVLKPNDRQTMLYTNKKLEMAMKSLVIPTMTKDESKKKRLNSKL